MNKLYFLSFTIFAIILYLYTPIKYDHTFCVICFFVYLMVALKIVVNDYRKIGLINFNLLFLFSFFACTYVYPLFLVNSDSIIGDIIIETISSSDTINKSVSLSTLSISLYGFAYNIVRKQKPLKVSEKAIMKTILIFKDVKNVSLLACVGMLTLLVSFINTPHDVNFEVNESPLLQEVFDSILPIFLVCSALFFNKGRKSFLKIKDYIMKNLNVYFFIFAMVFMYLIIGDRAPIISIVTMIISIIMLYIKRLRLITIFAIGIFGVLMMFAISATRQGASSIRTGGGAAFVQGAQSSMSSNSSVWDILSDLVGEVRELNEGIHYVDNQGLLYPGANAILLISAPIPYIPTLLVKNIYRQEMKNIKPGPVLGAYNNVGGNHCVADIYMPFGILGIIVLFTIFGILVAKVSNGMNKNLLCNIYYIYLMGNAIFMVRNSLTSLYRPFVFIFIIYSLFIYYETRMKGKSKIVR